MWNVIRVVCSNRPTKRPKRGRRQRRRARKDLLISTRSFYVSPIPRHYYICRDRVKKAHEFFTAANKQIHCPRGMMTPFTHRVCLQSVFRVQHNRRETTRVYTVLLFLLSLRGYYTLRGSHERGIIEARERRTRCFQWKGSRFTALHYKGEIKSQI